MGQEPRGRSATKFNADRETIEHGAMFEKDMPAQDKRHNQITLEKPHC